MHLRNTIHGAGPPVMLVAGTGYPSATWFPAAVERLAQNFSVITFDHRGTGDTPGSGDHIYSTRMLACDALELLNDLGADSAHVVGHSMGGRVAQWMALEKPQRVRSLVLAASGPGRLPGQPVREPGVPRSTVLGLVSLGYHGYVRRVQRRTFFTRDFAAERQDVTDWLTQAFWDNRPNLDEYLKHVVARQEHDTVALLPRIVQRSLVLVGDLDTTVGGTGSHVEQSRFLAAHLPNADLVILPGLRHGYFWECPVDSMALIAEWLREVDRGRD